MFASLKNLNARPDPHDVTIDFEIAAIEALKSIFPKANIKGCSFYFPQANWRKIRSLGLSKEYQNNTDVRIVLKSFVACALIPEKDIFLGFQNLRVSTAKMQNEKIAEIVCCFEATWLGGKSLRERPTGASFFLNFVANLKTSEKCDRKLDFPRRKRNAAENEIISLQAGKEVTKLPVITRMP